MPLTAHFLEKPIFGKLVQAFLAFYENHTSLLWDMKYLSLRDAYQSIGRTLKMEPVVRSKLPYHSSRLHYVTFLTNNLHTHRLRTSKLQFRTLLTNKHTFE